MVTEKLTNKKAKAESYKGDGTRAHFVWDSVITGMGLRVYPSGKKAWVMSYRIKGKKKLLVLGRFPVMLEKGARISASDNLALVRKGIDPLEEKRRKARGESFGDLIDTYLEQHSAGKKSGDADHRRLNSHIPRSWRSRGVESITRAEFRKLYREIGKDRPYEANRLQALVRHLFNWAAEQSPSYISRDAMRDGWKNPAVVPKESKFKEHARKVWVRPEQLPNLAAAIDVEPNIYVRAVMWLYLLTGARRSELLTARREHVDWETKRLRLPDTKAGEEQFIPLSGPALAILQGIPEEEGNPYLFPGAKKGRPLVNISKPWQRIRAKAGMPDVRLHDLRRTVGSWLSSDNVDLNRIKDALRHADLSTTLIYAQLGDESARDALEDHGKRVLERAGKHGPLKVLDGGKSET